MGNVEIILLQLLQIGLGSKKDIGSIHLDEYLLKSLYVLSAKQTVGGVVLDGLLSSIGDSNVKYKTLLQWYGVVCNIETRNKKLNSIAAEVFDKFNNVGLSQ